MILLIQLAWQLIKIILAYGWPLLVGLIIGFIICIFIADNIARKKDKKVEGPSCILMISIAVVIAVCFYVFVIPALYSFGDVWTIDGICFKGHCTGW